MSHSPVHLYTDLYGPVMSNMSASGHVPEARVLIIMTGGTICMQKSPNGLVPARNFLERCMSPRPEFNDGESVDPVEVRFHDGADGLGELQSLRTPTSVYGKRVR
jgi:60kDa lysophospholipase